jgi:hypothetical protein
LDDAQREHEERSGKLEADRQAIENRIEAEDARWERERERETQGCTAARSGIGRQAPVNPPES